MNVLRAMTYNVHGCVGTDGVLDEHRVARVIERYAPDVVALQELDVGRRRSLGRDQPRVLAERLGYGVHFTAARRCEGGTYGNAILTRFPFEVRSEGLLPVRRGEVRSVQWVRLATPATKVDVLNTHLGLDRRERELQVDTLVSAEWLAHVERAGAVIVCGDFNAGPRSRVYERLVRDLVDAQSSRRKPLATWPSRFPVVRLDHVLSTPSARARACFVPRDALVRAASDHLPIVVDFDIDVAVRPKQDETVSGSL